MGSVDGDPRTRLLWLWELLHDDARRRRTLGRIGLTTLGAVSLMGYATAHRRNLPLDVGVALRLQGIRHPSFRDLMVLVSMPGFRPWNVALTLALSALVAWRLSPREGGYLLLTTALAGPTNRLLKRRFGRTRPADGDGVEVVLPPTPDPSFPSGHVMLYVVFYGFLWFLAWARMRRSPLRALVLTVAGGLVLLVGPSRIYLGAHWLSDVVAAYLVGLFLLLVAIELYVKYVGRDPWRALAAV